MPRLKKNPDLIIPIPIQETIPEPIPPTEPPVVPIIYNKDGSVRKKRGAPKIAKPEIKAGKIVIRNELGQRLTRKGTIDRRGEQGLKNLQKSTVFQAIQKSKEAKAKASKVLELEPDSESSDEEADEYHVEEIVVKKKAEPQVVEVEKIVEKVVEVEKPDLESKKIAEKLKEENAKIKNQFTFHDHLNKINDLSRKMRINF